MRRLSLLAFGVMLGTLACSDSPSSPSGNSATFNLRLTDSPFRGPSVLKRLPLLLQASET